MASIVLLTICTTPIAAYMIKRTGTIQNDFVPASVECKVIENFSNNEKSIITVENDGNIDAYIRVRLVTYWSYEGGDAVSGTNSENIDIAQTDLGTNWLKGKEANTYYYALKVSSGFTTTNLLGSTFVIELSEGQIVVVLAEAIQADPKNAVIDAWDVEIVDEKIVINS